MITLVEIVPASLAQAPTNLTTKELERLLTVHSLDTATLRGLTANYVRKLAKKAGAAVVVKEINDVTCQVVAIKAPRGTTTLAQLDSEIVWHSERLTALVLDRQKTIAYDLLLQSVEDEAGDIFASEPDVAPPPAGEAPSDLSPYSIFGTDPSEVG